MLTSDLKNQKLAALIDPFGINPFLYTTKYWTVAEKNTLSIGFSGFMLWNRLIWLGVGALIFAFAYWRFSFAERSPRKKKVKAQRDRINHFHGDSSGGQEFRRRRRVAAILGHGQRSNSSAW